MLRYLLKRLLAAIPAIVGVSTVVFLSLRLMPGDPILIMFADVGASAETITRLREQYHLNDPLYIQYVRFMGDALQGDLGRSMQTNVAVATGIRQQLPSTIQLTLAGMSVALAIGLLAGTIAAARQHSALDYGTMAAALGGVSVPSFWLGLMLMLIFAVQLRWLPTSGQGTLRHLILPAITLGLGPGAVIARMVRSCLLEVLGADYIRTARAKGLAGRAVMVRHALRNALIPVVTVVGLQVGSLLSGAFVVETVFARQGLGFFTVNAILKRDYPVVQGMILFTSLIYVSANLIVDIICAFLDPRIRYD